MAKKKNIITIGTENEMKENEVSCASEGCPHLEHGICTHRCVKAAFKNGRNTAVIKHRGTENKLRLITDTAKALAQLSWQSTFTLIELKDAKVLSTVKESIIDEVFQTIRREGLIFLAHKTNGVEYWKFVEGHDNV